MSNVAIVGVISLLMIVLFAAIPIMIGIYVYRDATRRGLSGILWTLIAILAPGFIGLIVYLIVRTEHPATYCQNCGQNVHERYAACPYCGAPLKAKCDNCGNPIEAGWVVCPGCGNEISEYQQEIAKKVSVQKVKDKGLGKILAIVIIVPLALCILLMIGIAMFSFAGGGYYTMTSEGRIEEYNSEVADWAAECDASGKGVYVLSDVDYRDDYKHNRFLIYRNDGHYFCDYDINHGGWFKSPSLTLNFNNAYAQNDYTLFYIEASCDDDDTMKLGIFTDGAKTEFDAMEYTGFSLDEMMSNDVEMSANIIDDSTIWMEIDVDDDLREVYSISVTAQYDDGTMSTDVDKLANNLSLAGQDCYFTLPNGNKKVTSFTIEVNDSDGNELYNKTVVLGGNTNSDVYVFDLDRTMGEYRLERE